METTEKQPVKEKFYFQVAPNVWGTKDIFVNIYMIKDSESDKWVLVDAGLKTSAGKIKKMAADLFGEDNKPKAIIMTHGHFDHVGSLEILANQWHVPVYAHYLELPYLTGKSSYPPLDPTVGGGLMSTMAFLYSTKPVDVSSFITALPEDGTIPVLPGWRWIHTPGHTPGHISLFRDEDKVLIAGDAFVTTKAESALSTALQKKLVSGPPAYATTDWVAAYNSVKKLLLLQPETAATGHGKPMYGTELLRQLLDLYEHFDEIGIPEHGRYVKEAAVQDANGILYVPPMSAEDNYKKWIYITSAALFAASILLVTTRKKKKRFSLLK
ncbi:MBL fold metallo-hydrolase [Ilyomonas limi]|uniref:MBL fold metallo-hydrolase n=1 Tax=Ilyomonas limi TaxID=2575867 RepID=A0A4V5UUG5_9BACT|nr:MBL fold metallo-hydrolase [Ilyomonas limi]TKK68963.1 MBL fold metallo-hydrolase [Ilyomonas limi]